MKTFKGRVVCGGQLTGEAVVSHQGVNTLATFQKSALMQSKKSYLFRPKQQGHLQKGTDWQSYVPAKNHWLHNWRNGHSSHLFNGNQPIGNALFAEYRQPCLPAV
jgi:hypothetical protein